MIPKLIHYCWFGRGEMPLLAKKCIKSWKMHLPDYQTKLWNEDNFDITSNSYVFEAYQAGKFAFVTDYVRLFALFNEGGIYMDTDVEVLKNLDVFLHLPAFSGFEGEKLVPTGIMASEVEGQWVKEQLEYYNNRHFRLPDGTMDTTSNVNIISGNMRNGGFIFDNTIQNYKGLVTMYPSEYFCPKSWDTGKIKLTQNTYCIHHFAESWIPKSKRIKKKILRFIGEKNTNSILKLTRILKG
jgi:hypothetical protein